jgi:uncharacterized protein YjlB
MPASLEIFHFEDDGETPNNPRLPLVVYHGPLTLEDAADPAAVFEESFAQHGWIDSWRNGIFDFLHFHTATHEVLGIVRGHVTVEFGGAEGRQIELRTGDVAVLPAGTGHRRTACSADLLVVGAYPKGGTYDQPRPTQISHGAAVAAIARTPLPDQDPVYGRDGPLKLLWNA